MTFTKEQLHGMPIFQIRGLDIKSKEDELLVQEVLDEKLQNEPTIDPNRITFTSGQTDGLTPAKEAELQKQIDGEETVVEYVDSMTPEERVEEEKIQESVVVTTAESLEIPTIEATVPEGSLPVDSVKAPFCQFCDSKGVRHKKECTRLSANINTNV